MAVGNEESVQLYVKRHAEMLAMLENLTEFVNSMPAPDEDAVIQGVDHGY